MQHHRIQATAIARKSSTARRAGPLAPQWPSYQGTSQFVGISPSGRATLYVDPTLGAPALQNAEDLVNDADRIANANDAIFGTTGGSVSVIVFALGGATDGTGGADHGGCDYTTGNAIEVCASFGNSARVSALFEAELSECSMGGNLCGASTGEALSRWCAAQVGNDALSDFATAPTWARDGSRISSIRPIPRTKMLTVRDAEWLSCPGCSAKATHWPKSRRLWCRSVTAEHSRNSTPH